MAELGGRVAIVTGASRGIGRATSLALARSGATVVAAARTAEKLTSLAAEAGDARAGGRIVTRPFDVTDATGVDKWVDEIATELGRIDILVNNAGITRDGLLLNMTDAQFDEVLTTNLRSVFWLTRSVARYMVRARFGRIINVASVSGLMGNAGQANYAAAKAGVVGFTKTVAKELAKRGVTCNAVAPGFIRTDMTNVLPEKVKEAVLPLIPMQRFGEPDEVAGVIQFLASAAAGYVNGQTISVDGGLYM